MSSLPVDGHMGARVVEFPPKAEARADAPVMLALHNPGVWAGVVPPEREWQWLRFLPMRQATYLTGGGSVGKSLLAQLLATCVALGLPCLGVDTRMAVSIYLTCEDDLDELHRRQVAICEALGVPIQSLSGRLHLVSLAGGIGNELATFDAAGRMSTTPGYQALRATMLSVGAGFVALDNVAHLFAGNENIRNQVAAFCGLLNALAADCSASVLFLGHPNKAGDSFSGSTAWENQVRSRLFMDWPRDEAGKITDPDARTLTLGKSNYARNGDALKFRWHRWSLVLDADLPDDERSSMAAEVAATAADTAFLACLDERNRQRRAVSESPASRTYAPKEFADMPEGKRIGRARLEAAMDRLFRIGTIKRGFVYRDASEGKDRIGIRRVSADVPADHPLTPPADVPLTTRRPPLTHTPSTTYYAGAALEADAPAEDEPDEAAQQADTWNAAVLAARGQAR